MNLVTKIIKDNCNTYILTIIGSVDGIIVSKHTVTLKSYEEAFNSMIDYLLFKSPSNI